MAFTALSNPLRHTPLQMVAGWIPSGFISTDSLKDTVARAVPGDWVDHPNYWAVACDYETGRRIPFGRLGSPRAHIGDAVAASCAIPGFYRPVKIGRAATWTAASAPSRTWTWWRAAGSTWSSASTR